MAYNNPKSARSKACSRWGWWWKHRPLELCSPWVEDATFPACIETQDSLVVHVYRRSSRGHLQYLLQVASGIKLPTASHLTRTKGNYHPDTRQTVGTHACTYLDIATNDPLSINVPCGCSMPVERAHDAVAHLWEHFFSQFTASGDATGKPTGKDSYGNRLNETIKESTSMIHPSQRQMQIQ